MWKLCLWVLNMFLCSMCKIFLRAQLMRDCWFLFQLHFCTLFIFLCCILHVINIFRIIIHVYAWKGFILLHICFLPVVTCSYSNSFCIGVNVHSYILSCWLFQVHVLRLAYITLNGMKTKKVRAGLFFSCKLFAHLQKCLLAIPLEKKLLKLSYFYF